MMDVWDPLTERVARAAPASPRRWWGAALLLFVLSAGGWCLVLWLLVVLWGRL